MVFPLSTVFYRKKRIMAKRQMTIRTTNRTGLYPWKRGIPPFPLCVKLCQLAVALALVPLAHSATPQESDRREPATARDFYNEGTRYLSQSNLWRAEYSLQHSLDLQDSRFQPPALYNLGHI